AAEASIPFAGRKVVLDVVSHRGGRGTRWRRHWSWMVCSSSLWALLRLAEAGKLDGVHVPRSDGGLDISELLRGIGRVDDHHPRRGQRRRWRGSCWARGGLRSAATRAQDERAEQG